MSFPDELARAEPFVLRPRPDLDSLLAGSLTGWLLPAFGQ